MTMVWVDLKPGEGGVQPILDFLTEILPDTRGFDGCQDIKVYVAVSYTHLTLPTKSGV